MKFVSAQLTAHIPPVLFTVELSQLELISLHQYLGATSEHEWIKICGDTYAPGTGSGLYKATKDALIKLGILSCAERERQS